MPSLRHFLRQQHSQFLSFLRNTVPPGFSPPPGFPVLPCNVFSQSRTTYETTLQLSKISSHIRFLDTCLRRKVVPKGFQIPFHLQSTSHTAIHQAKTVCLRTSRSLMNVQVQSLRKQFLCTRLSLNQCKTTLRNFCLFSPPLFNMITNEIRTLNNRCFDFLQSNKAKKLLSLCGPPNGACHPPNQTRAVVTIPSDLPLTSDERSALAKGLTFVPLNQTPDKFQILHDLEGFYRRLRLLAHFCNNTNTNATPTIFDKINPHESVWNPPVSQLPALELFIKVCKTQIQNLDLDTCSGHSNLSKSEKSALSKLNKRTDIVIKPADKGGAIVVWRQDLYISEAVRQLSNTDFYTTINTDPTPTYQQTVADTIQDAITNEELPEKASQLIVDHPRTPCFYMLPKIHKPENPGRPIVSACSCPTAHISAFLDAIFQPIVASLPTFIKDTKHALNIIEGIRFTGNNRFIFTLDITSLYTVIPHSDGLNAVKHFLNRRTDQYPSTEILIRLTELVLNLNGFAFADKYYQQVCGVAMGTKMGPSYANIFVGWVEELFFLSYTGPLPDYFGRFIDDCLGVSSGSTDDLNQFITSLSHAHPSLKYTSTISDSAISFLDINLTIFNDRITTSIYYKPTDSHSYLHYNSCHPPHTKNSIPYSQLLRLKRICSDDTDFRAQAETMCSFFESKQYPENITRQALTRVNNVTRQSTLTEKPKRATQDNRIPLVLTFHPTSKLVSSVIYNNFSILQNDDSTKAIFPDKPLLSHRRDRNIRDILVHSSLKTNNNSAVGTFPCRRPRCVTCKHVHSSAMITGPKNTYKILGSHTCTTSNLVYCISCDVCPNVLYIGETQRKLGDRFREHLFSIRHNTGNHIANHFNSARHTLDNISVCVLKATACGTKARRTQENRLIFTMGTEYPAGLNEILSFR